MNTSAGYSLEQLGLNKKEAEVYLSVLEIGGGTVAAISKKAQVQRVNTYYVLEQLLNKGFVYSSKDTRGQKYYAISPSEVVERFEARLKQLKGIIPELNSIENAKSNKPKIQFFEGIEGVKHVYDVTLQEDEGAEILAIGSAEKVLKILGEKWAENYLVRRREKRISMRAIVENSAAAKLHKARDHAELRETLLMDTKRFPFSNEINILNNKIIIASYGEFFGVIIESVDVSETLRSFFELAWLGAQQNSVNIEQL